MFRFFLTINFTSRICYQLPSSESAIAKDSKQATSRQDGNLDAWKCLMTSNKKFLWNETFIHEG